MKPELIVWRIEDEDGIGPFKWTSKPSFLPDDCLKKLWNIPGPICDYKIFQAVDKPYNQIFEDLLCRNYLKHCPTKCVFGFPSYEIFKKWVGQYEDQIAEYVTTYRTRHYIISDSGEQILFVKEG